MTKPTTKTRAINHKVLKFESLRCIVLLAVYSFIFELKYTPGQHMQFDMLSEKIGIFQKSGYSHWTNMKREWIGSTL